MQNSSRFHHGNRAKGLIRKNFPARFSCPPSSQLEKRRPLEPSQPALSYEHIEKFAKD